MATPHDNHPRRALLLTGATAASAMPREALFGRRLARHHLLAPSVPENCPWRRTGGHIRSTFADPQTRWPRSRSSNSGSRTASCMPWSTTRRSRPRRQGKTTVLDRNHDRRVGSRLPVNFFGSHHAGARPGRGAQGRQGSVVNVVTSIAGSGSILRRHRLFHLEGRAGVAYARDGGRFRPSRHPCQRHRAGRDRHPRSLTPALRKSSSRFRCIASARPTRSPRSSIVLCTDTSSYVNGAEIHINGGQHVVSGAGMRAAVAADRQAAIFGDQFPQPSIRLAGGSETRAGFFASA